ncbi:MAG: sigma-70 family RNA polymerase sigma factor, partial [Ilumatobacter sp.]|uniref:RNA polymerase sigma factor n=1 Tax=Ilumatobacter sp. TaxID=1967498 RepID=UPI003C758579
TDALAVRAVLADLPERDREVIVLRYYLDLPVSEIADQLSAPVGTVKSLIHRATNRLRSALTEETSR